MGLARHPFKVQALPGIDNNGDPAEPVVILEFDHGHGTNLFAFTIVEARQLADTINTTVAALTKPARPARKPRTAVKAAKTTRHATRRR